MLGQARTIFDIMLLTLLEHPLIASMLQYALGQGLTPENLTSYEQQQWQKYYPKLETLGPTFVEKAFDLPGKGLPIQIREEIQRMAFDAQNEMSKYDAWI